MKPWLATANLVGVFHEDALSLEEKSVAIQQLMAPVGKRVDPGSDELDCLLEELVDAGEADDTSWFDAVWNGIYDWADEYRVWLRTR